MNVTGEFDFWQIRNGVVIRTERKKNLVVSGSRGFLGDIARGYGFSSALNAIAIGTGSVAPATGNTTLGTEVFRMALPAPGTSTPLQGNLISLDPVVVTLRQTLTPFVAVSGVPTTPLGGTQVITEFGLFGDILTIANPATPTIDSQTSGGGTVAATNYDIKVTWVNNNGETAASSEVAHTQSAEGTFTVDLGTAPAEAVKARLYIDTTSSGTYYLFGTEVTDLSADPVQFTVTTPPPVSGTEPPTVNTTTVPGENDTGRLFNRALIGEPGGVSMSGSDQIMIESRLTFG
jgi:hypothetical protein